MHERMKIQLFVNVVKALERIYPDTDFTVDWNTIRSEDISMTISGDNNEIRFEIEGNKTGFKYFYNIPWFVSYKETFSTIQEIIHGYKTYTELKINELIIGIKSILNSKYQLEPSHESLENNISIEYKLEEDVKVMVKIIESSVVDLTLLIGKRRVSNIIELQVREFTPEVLMEFILPTFDVLIDKFNRS